MGYYNSTRRAMGLKRIIDIPRPTERTRWNGWRHDQTYEAWLIKDKARIASIKRDPVGDRKERMVVNAYEMRDGVTFRLVDGHGKTYGPRFTAPTDLVDKMARVRMVERQEEDLLSELTRMRNRAHRAAVKG